MEQHLIQIWSGGVKRKRDSSDRFGITQKEEEKKDRGSVLFGTTQSTSGRTRISRSQTRSAPISSKVKRVLLGRVRSGPIHLSGPNRTAGPQEAPEKLRVSVSGISATTLLRLMRVLLRTISVTTWSIFSFLLRSFVQYTMEYRDCSFSRTCSKVHECCSFLIHVCTLISLCFRGLISCFFKQKLQVLDTMLLTCVSLREGKLKRNTAQIWPFEN